MILSCEIYKNSAMHKKGLILPDSCISGDQPYLMQQPYCFHSAAAPLASVKVRVRLKPHRNCPFVQDVVVFGIN